MHWRAARFTQFPRVITSYSIHYTKLYDSLALAGAAQADVTATEEMSYDVDPGARISLENVNGDIRVSGGGDRVHIVAHKKASYNFV